MPILNAREDTAGNRPADPPASLAAALAACRAAHFDAARNVFDYGAFRHSAEYGSLQAAASALAAFDCASLGVGRRIPFWLNVYNALVLHGVIAREVGDSVRSVGDFYSESKYRVGGHEFSLDDIEHGLLRMNAAPRRGARRPMREDDPRQALAPILFDERVHFAMYSACRSSPALTVFGAATIEDELEAAARAHLRAHVRLANGGAALLVPKIFDWYEADFGGTDGVRAFVIARLERDEDVEAIDRRGRRVALKYQEFDWSLNAP